MPSRPGRLPPRIATAKSKVTRRSCMMPDMRLALVLAAITTLPACGGGHAKIPSRLLAQGDAGASAVALPPSTALEGARFPPPLQLGSRHVERRPLATSEPCRAAARGPVADAAQTLDALVRACAASLKPAAAPLVGQQDSTAAAGSAPLRADKGKCYRVLAAASSGVKSLVVQLVDADGAVAAEYHSDDLAPTIVPAESVCFKDDQAARVTASVGAGVGTFAVKVLAD